MANITTYLENKLLEHSVKGNWTTSLPTTTYAGLFIVSPTIAYTSTSPTGTEVYGAGISGGYRGYQRKQITWGSANNGQLVTSADLVWNQNTGYWNSTQNSTSAASVVSVGIFDSQLSTGTNNLLWFGPLSTAITINSGDSFTISVGNLSVSLS